MQIIVESPSKAFVKASGEELDCLRKQLSYVNTANQHQLMRHARNHWFKNSNLERWTNQYNELKASVHNCVMFSEMYEDYIRPGSISYLKDFQLSITNNIKYPTPKKVAWEKPLPFELYYYQEETWKLLLEAKHGNAELCTGAGKSAILLKICRETGFPTAIIAPSKSIFNELLEKFEYHFGKKMVGRFGDGKKVLGKRFTICIGDSIANIKPGTEEWEFFSKLSMVCVDESHTWGADSLEQICHGVLADVPYRFFFSGTQTRGDGTAKLLQSIIGPTVYTLTTAQAVAGGFICPHDYTIIEVESSNPNYATPDILDMKRVHYLGNKNICAFYAKLANAMALSEKKQTLILVEELHQIASLVKLLKVPYAYAHSEKKPDRLRELGLEKVDSAESVEKFNKGEALVLIGTSCISVGTNIYPTHNTCNWQGGTSEIKTKQGAVGRSVRLGSQNPWASKCVPKTKATIWDADVTDICVMHAHLEDRVEFYTESGSEIKRIRLKK